MEHIDFLSEFKVMYFSTTLDRFSFLWTKCDNYSVSKILDKQTSRHAIQILIKGFNKIS